MQSANRARPDLHFQVAGAAPERYSAAPQMLFSVRINDRSNRDLIEIQSVMLHCQIRIEPGRRNYDSKEAHRLIDLFDTRDRWGQTLRSMLWTHASVVVPSFSGSTAVDLPVPCSYDFNLAATKYFDALGGGEIPLCFLFSGTIFYASEDAGLQATQIPWEREAAFNLPASAWRSMMDLYYPNMAWLGIHKDTFGRLREYRSRQGLATWEETLEKLIDCAREAPTP